jgi:hypothetical protein
LRERETDRREDREKERKRERERAREIEKERERERERGLLQLKVDDRHLFAPHSVSENDYQHSFFLSFSLAVLPKNTIPHLQLEVGRPDFFGPGSGLGMIFGGSGFILWAQAFSGLKNLLNKQGLNCCLGSSFTK